MAKSELFTAWRPSLPLMPTPTCASWIMPTSFAPSPMERVTGLGSRPFLTSRTNSRLWAGLTRHATTVLHSFPMVRSMVSRSKWPKISESVGPSTMSARWSDVTSESGGASGVRSTSPVSSRRGCGSDTDPRSESGTSSALPATAVTALRTRCQIAETCCSSCKALEKWCTRRRSCARTASGSPSLRWRRMSTMSRRRSRQE
mmetsp:Transcript_16347/g.55517  ORF Transcript_16347/g.55517 Transcript_16347/m.55517 type:complete len:202 (-) Transcript_16347:201-806(-)